MTDNLLSGFSEQLSFNSATQIIMELTKAFDVTLYIVILPARSAK